LAVNSAYKITGMLDSYHAQPFLTMLIAAADHRERRTSRSSLEHIGGEIACGHQLTGQFSVVVASAVTWRSGRIQG
jgi:hypothetical protein